MVTIRAEHLTRDALGFFGSRTSVAVHSLPTRAQGLRPALYVWGWRAAPGSLCHWMEARRARPSYARDVRGQKVRHVPV